MTTKKIIRATMALLLLAALSACAAANAKVDPTDYDATDVLCISGIGNADIQASVADLAGMDCAALTTFGYNVWGSKNTKIGDVSVVGPTLNTICEAYGASLKSYRSVVITADDGYEVHLDKAFLAENEALLAFKWNGETLTGKNGPLRLVIPKDSTARWISKVSNIAFEK